MFPSLGKLHPNDIKPSDVLATIRKIEARGAFETASKILQRVNAVFGYGIVTGWTDNNPASNINKALEKYTPSEFSYIPFKDMPSFMAKLDNYGGEPITKLGLKLLIHTFLRSGEVRHGKWSEIEWQDRLWRIPAHRMKSRREHLVPLTDASLNILHEIHKYTGNCELILPSRNKAYLPMSENTFCSVIKRLGYKATAHGFRKTASTTLNEHGFNSDHIELQLAHVPSNKVRHAYNKAQYLQERREMMDFWSQTLISTN